MTNLMLDFSALIMWSQMKAFSPLRSWKVGEKGKAENLPCVWESNAVPSPKKSRQVDQQLFRQRIHDWQRRCVGIFPQKINKNRALEWMTIGRGTPETIPGTPDSSFDPEVSPEQSVSGNSRDWPSRPCFDIWCHVSGVLFVLKNNQ